MLLCASRSNAELDTAADDGRFLARLVDADPAVMDTVAAAADATPSLFRLLDSAMALIWLFSTRGDVVGAAPITCVRSRRWRLTCRVPVNNARCS